jgi:hypothetical protein
MTAHVHPDADGFEQQTQRRSLVPEELPEEVGCRGIKALGPIRSLVSSFTHG